MKQLLVCAWVVALLALGGAAFAEDLSSWGHGATPEPYADAGSACSAEPRSGYWWWPTEPESNANDSELWGNRGIVYGMYVPKKEEVVTPQKPDDVRVVKVKRETPVFNHVLFDFDKSVLKAEGKAEADKVVAALKKHSKDTLVIEGHTCNVGEEDYNMGLGQRRADAIKKYLVGQGIAAGRINAKSFGESKPAVSNDTPDSRKKNRRGIFVVTVVD